MQLPWEKWGACSLETVTFSQTLVGERAGLALSNETWRSPDAGQTEGNV